MTRLLMIGAGGLDWPGFTTHARSAAIPRMAALRAGGQAGSLTGASFSARLANWVTLATGARPERHGVWRTMEAWPGGLRPVSHASWRAQPLWARLATAGIATGSVAWPAIRPGESWDGLHIDEDVARASSRDPADWALPPHALPRDAREAIRGRRVHPAQITADMLAPLVPAIATINQSRDSELPALAVAMARTATIHGCATWMLEPPAPEAMFVFLPWLSDVRARFEAHRTGAFAGVMTGAWRFLDTLIGRLVDMAGPGATVMIVSAGFHDHAGVLIAAGPGVDKDADFAGADILSVAPTALAVFGFEDPALPGRRLDIVSGPSELVPAPTSWLPGRMMPDPRLVRTARAAGYRTPPKPSSAWHAQGAAQLALILIERDPKAAAEAAQAALDRDPENIVALRVRVRAHVALNEAAPLPALAETLAKLAPDRGYAAMAWGAHHLIEGKVALAEPWLTKAEVDWDPTTLVTIAGLWLSAGRSANAARVFRRVLEIDPFNAAAEIGLAMDALNRRDFAIAEQALARARTIDPARPAIYLQLAQLYAKTARSIDADLAAQMGVRYGADPALAAAAARGGLDEAGG